MVREPFNALSHALGVPLALLGSGLLLLLAPREVWPALLIFGLTMAFMFGASTLYHALRVGDKALAWLRRLDHAAIFLFIAGSYTPFLVEGLQESWKPFALGLVWGLALLGVGFRLFFLRAPRWLYTLAYLALGWLSVIFLPKLHLPLSTFGLMAISGAFYTLGAWVYARRKPDPWPGKVGFHGLWHLLVLLGSLFMYLAVLSLYTSLSHEKVSILKGMEPPLILIVEDEKDIARFIELELQAEGYRTEVAYDGITGLSRFREVNPNLVILDLMLPVMDGIEVAKRIRKTSNVPILILTAKDRVEDKVEGLDAGADDYLVKPFSIEELLARVRAHLRRVSPAITGEIRVADLIINLEGREVFRGGRRIELSNKEFELLELLARNPGKVFSRYEIEEKVWPGYQGGSNVVDVYIGYLRKKLEAAGERRLIHTVRGVGYVLRED